MSASERLLDELRSMKGLFYVYRLNKPSGETFYIGYGRAGRKPRERIFLHETEARAAPCGRQNDLKLNTIRKIWRSGCEVGKSIEAWFETEEQAKAKEISLISEIGRIDLGTGPLTNLTCGGDGAVALTGDGKRRMRLGQEKGHASRAKWALQNPSRLREMGVRLGRVRQAQLSKDPVAARNLRSAAGKIGRRKADQFLAANPDTRIKMSVLSAEASRKWALENPGLASRNGIIGYQSGLKKWIESDPERAQRHRLIGLQKTFHKFMNDEVFRSKQLERMCVGAEQWRQQNPERVFEHGRRQAERQKEKARLRKECQEIVKRMKIAFDLPSGRAGLVVWQNTLSSLKGRQA